MELWLLVDRLSIDDSVLMNFPSSIVNHVRTIEPDNGPQSSNKERKIRKFERRMIFRSIVERCENVSVNTRRDMIWKKMSRARAQLAF